MSVRNQLSRLTWGEQLAIAFFVISIFVYLLNPINISLVLGNSMDPTFDHGDIVVYSEYIEMQEGKMVVYKGGDGEMISHRLVDKKSEGKYLAKGDNNDYIDETVVTSDNYEGTILGHFNTSEYIPTEYLWKYYPGSRNGV